MLEDHAKLLAFFEQAKEVVGRKRLQKMIYILKKMELIFQNGTPFIFMVHTLRSCLHV